MVTDRCWEIGLKWRYEMNKRMFADFRANVNNLIYSKYLYTKVETFSFIKLELGLFSFSEKSFKW